MRRQPFKIELEPSLEIAENFVVDAVRSGLEAVVGLLGGREGDEAEPTEREKSLMNLRFQAKFSPH